EICLDRISAFADGQRDESETGSDPRGRFGSLLAERIDADVVAKLRIVGERVAESDAARDLVAESRERVTELRPGIRVSERIKWTVDRAKHDAGIVRVCAVA